MNGQAREVTRLALATRWGRRVRRLHAGTAVLALALLGGCGDGDGDRGAGGPAGPGQPTAGREVTVRGTVTDIPGRQVVVVGRAGYEPSLVIFRQPTSIVVGSVLEVTGRVRTMRVAELEAELGTDLEPSAERFEGQSCLLVSAGSAPG
ncbi:MAG: hypothetical protein M3179_08565 [Actinomycetota bacterium]|nr:hypothetical protein [Actinomycetota bacterium]